MGNEQELNDTELLRKYECGDIESCETLILRHGAALFGYLLAMTGNQCVAEDLVQDTWLKVLRQTKKFKGGVFRAWLFRIARNLMIDRSRRRTEILLGNDEQSEFLLETLSAPDREPWEELSGKDQEMAIRACVDNLPEKQREVFLLRTLAGMSFAEIAELLNIPLNTALGRMHYAVTRLRQMLQPLIED